MSTSRLNMLQVSGRSAELLYGLYVELAERNFPPESMTDKNNELCYKSSSKSNESIIKCYKPRQTNKLGDRFAFPDAWNQLLIVAVTEKNLWNQKINVSLITKLGKP